MIFFSVGDVWVGDTGRVQISKRPFTIEGVEGEFIGIKKLTYDEYNDAWVTWLSAQDEKVLPLAKFQSLYPTKYEDRCSRCDVTLSESQDYYLIPVSIEVNSGEEGYSVSHRQYCDPCFEDIIPQLKALGVSGGLVGRDED